VVTRPSPSFHPFGQVLRRPLGRPFADGRGRAETHRQVV
jgi:hypothetical protein